MSPTLFVTISKQHIKNFVLCISNRFINFSLQEQAGPSASSAAGKSLSQTQRTCGSTLKFKISLKADVHRNCVLRVYHLGIYLFPVTPKTQFLSIIMINQLILSAEILGVFLKNQAKHKYITLEN
jgi:hypothetical protein